MPYKDPKSDAAKASLKRRRKRYFETHGGYTAVAKSYASRHPNALRNSYYKCVHGVTLEEFEAQIAAQGGLCPIGNHPFGPRGRQGDSPCQDHNHENGENRAILCRNHNVALGLFNDSIADMEAAIQYVRQYKKV